MIQTKKTYSFAGSNPAIGSLMEHGLPGVRVESNSKSPVLLTVHDVSRVLNVHENTVRRWSNQGVLKSLRLGPRGDRRYKLQDIADYLISLQSGAVPPNK